LSEWDRISGLLHGVAEGQPNAWPELLALLGPQLDRMTRNQPVGRLRHDEDVQRDIVASVIAKLYADEHRVIKKLVAAEPQPVLQAWFRVLVRRAAIDIMRGRPEFRRGGKEKQPGWVSLATLVTRDGANAPSSLIAKQREVSMFMARSLKEASAAIASEGDQAAAVLAAQWKIAVVHSRRLVKRVEYFGEVLELVFAGHSYVEIAKQMGLSRREVELIVGYIEEFFHARGFAS